MIKCISKKQKIIKGIYTRKGNFTCAFDKTCLYNGVIFKMQKNCTKDFQTPEMVSVGNHGLSCAGDSKNIPADLV